MHGRYGNPDAVAREIGGQFRPGVDRIVRRKFGDVAKVLWPENTEAYVASIAKVDVRTARRWLRGEYDPPICIAEAVLHETFKIQGGAGNGKAGVESAGYR